MTFKNAEKYTWSLYAQSEHGKEVKNRFESDYLASSASMFDLFIEYNPQEAKYISKGNFDDLCETLFAYGVDEYDSPTSIEQAKVFFESIIDLGIYYESHCFTEKGDYRRMLADIVALSFVLYVCYPDYFIPYLYRYRFFDLKNVADKFDISLPEYPKKSDNKARCMYYWRLCELFYFFRQENNLTSAELCAFLYDFAPNLIGKIEKDMPKPAQAWFIGGKISDKESKQDVIFWQGNKDTKRGDILVHYETSPVCAITHIWIAQTDGVIDPFFHFYSNIYVGDKIRIPNITQLEIRKSQHFSSHPLVRKNFQGVNGTPISSDDYKELLRLIDEKGFDTNKLPQLYAPRLPRNPNIKLERDVEVILLEPLLNSLGFSEGDGYIRQIPIRAGRGSRIYPDYALNCKISKNDVTAKVLIEAKLYMRNSQELESAFIQAKSYAKLLDSSVIVLCDKECLIVYRKTDGFLRNRYKKYYWCELEKPDKYNELKDILIK